MAIAVPTTAPGGARPRTDREHAPRRWEVAALVLVGAGFLALQLVLQPRALGLDEATYLSQVDPASPELTWVASRAWGVPVLAAPVAVFSPGLEAVRLYFAVLSAAGLVAAFWPWSGLVPAGVAPLGALLTATTWVTVYLGSLAMPNLFVALGAVALVALYLRAVVGRPGRGTTVLAGAVTALVALLRPTDSVLLAGPLVAAGLLVPWLRRSRALAAVVVGGFSGWLPWVLEAYARFGSPLQRLRAGEQAGPHGLTIDGSLLLILPRLLDGRPNYCCSGGPVTSAGPLPTLLTGWLLAVPLLALLGLLLAGRHRRTPMVLVVVPAVLLAAFYLLLPSFVSPRFVLPTLALLALPVAVTLVRAAAAGRGRWRWATTALVALLVVAHVGLMVPVAATKLERESVARSNAMGIAPALRPLVAGRPCLVLGRGLHAAAYQLHCQAREHTRGGLRERVRQARADDAVVVAVLTGPLPRKGYLSTWEELRVAGLPRAYRAYVPPR